MHGVNSFENALLGWTLERLFTSEAYRSFWQVVIIQELAQLASESCKSAMQHAIGQQVTAQICTISGAFASALVGNGAQRLPAGVDREWTLSRGRSGSAYFLLCRRPWKVHLSEEVSERIRATSSMIYTLTPAQLAEDLG